MKQLNALARKIWDDTCIWQEKTRLQVLGFPYLGKGGRCRNMPTGRESGVGEGGHGGRASTFSKSAPDGKVRRPPVAGDAQEKGDAGVKRKKLAQDDAWEQSVRKSPLIVISRPRNGQLRGHHRPSLTNPPSANLEAKTTASKRPSPHS